MPAQYGGVACPKPQPKLLDRIQYKREREAKERAFRLAVWVRERGVCHDRVTGTVGEKFLIHSKFTFTVATT